MTNEELKELAKLVVTSDLPLSSVPMVRSLAHGVIRLFRENDAMREVVEAARDYCNATDKKLIPPLYVKLEEALSQLEKKTVDTDPEKK